MKANIPKNELNVNPQDYFLLTDLSYSHNETEIPEANELSLLEIVMQSGKRLQSSESLDIIRQRTAHSVASLPESIRQISKPQAFNVNISNSLEALRQSLSQES
ncbi:MAG: hypothetical protein ACRC80_36340 [Waterburya sp.]